MYKYLAQKYVCSVTHSVVRYLNVNLALVFTSGKTRIKKESTKYLMEYFLLETEQ